MKRNATYSICQMGANYYLLPLQSNSKAEHELGLPVLNETGKWIWDSLAEETTLDGLCLQYSKHFGINRQEAEADLREFLSNLAEADLLEGWIS